MNWFTLVHYGGIVFSVYQWSNGYIVFLICILCSCSVKEISIFTHLYNELIYSWGHSNPHVMIHYVICYIIAIFNFGPTSMFLIRNKKWTIISVICADEHKFYIEISIFLTFSHFRYIKYFIMWWFYIPFPLLNSFSSSKYWDWPPLPEPVLTSH